MTERGPEIVDYPTRPLSGSEIGRGRRRGGGLIERPGVPPSERTAPEPGRDVARGPLISAEGLVKIYKVADLEVVALQGLDLLVQPGEFIALVGASGSGKSTLLNILAGLDVPSAGRCVVAGHDLGDMGRRERTAYRRRVVGFVWQQTARNLLGYLTIRQNVELPMLMNGLARRERGERAADLLTRVGLGDRVDHRPEALSGGEQQRAAIAVALANEPAVLLADEPTGELDTATAREIFDLLRTVNRELGVTIVVVTHDPLVSEQVSRTIAIRDGRTSTETLRRRARTIDGEHAVVSEEYAVLDRVGRLQLPRAHVEALGLEHRVRLVLEADHISVWPDRDPDDG
ncbi:MAG TPA: ABC transporter ATP-binding protein [Candidatus Binatus sp.]|nr:ABC transporter ATP-binding protein [Candidatus Binatus sp.]